jgi:fatty acid-binding protein DegV
MVTVVGDTTSGLTESFAAEHGVPIIPQINTWGSQSYFEGVDSTYDSFMDRLKVAAELPKTMAPPPELFTELPKQYGIPGDTLICVLPSATLSGTVRSARAGKAMARESGLPDLDVRNIYTHAEAEAADLRDDVQQTLGLAAIPVQCVPPAVVTYGCPGILGVDSFVEALT